MTARPAGWRWRLRRLGSWLVAAVVATGLGGVGATLALSVGAAPPASADPVADCTTTTGVVVAVDFQTFGGQIQVGCDPTLTTGMAAMEVAGFTPTGTSEYGLAFICLIDGYPENQSCTSTPPASASWSYWLADAGATGWTYSPAGASTVVPQPGSVEAWTFGSSSPNNKPDFAPSTVRATTSGPTSSTTTTGPPTAAGAGGGESSTATTGPGIGQESSPTTSPGASTGKSAPTAATTPVTTTTSGSTPTTTGVPASGTKSTPTTGSSTHDPAAPIVVAAAPASSGHHRAPGSPLPAIVAVVAVAALGGSAGIIAWRRRRAA